MKTRTNNAIDNTFRETAAEVEEKHLDKIEMKE